MWIPKEEAAALLAVSTRQVERLAASGKVRTQRARLPGDRSDRTVYNEADLKGIAEATVRVGVGWPAGAGRELATQQPPAIVTAGAATTLQAIAHAIATAATPAKAPYEHAPK